MPFMNDRKILIKIFNKFLSHYGSRHWWPAKTRFEIIISAILTQNVSWHNAKKALISLRGSGLLTPRKIVSAKHNVIASRIKSSRFYNEKTKKLKTFCSYLLDNYNGSLNKMFSKDMEELREELLDIKGLGKETVDCILLYAGKKLSFVSDAYTKRFLIRLGLIDNSFGYEDIRKYFMDYLPKDLYVYNEYHALIVHHGWATYKAKPECEKCPLKRAIK